jgi:hypothetical protein
MAGQQPSAATPRLQATSQKPGQKSALFFPLVHVRVIGEGATQRQPVLGVFKLTPVTLITRIVL